MSKKFDTSGKSPAYIHHRKDQQSPRRETGRGLFRSLTCRIGRRPHVMAPHPPMHRCQKRRKRAAVRALLIWWMICSKDGSHYSVHAYFFAGTRERAGTRRGKSPRSHAAPPRRSAMRISLGIRFAPEMIASSDHAAHFIHTEAGGRMTSYLIALALAGLVTIAVWEGFQ
ncbi:hypothetical protein KMZ68_19425 [Bradyrhizobium sediminis]|uniref:Uncharacterized protein n=1 Tax=Bradyrhizobium sediminis TaxID=2840469 RepID=A0A975NNC3_9BRAD|nr:hypothetical protein [Bradyrhizobium sediminis]QWG17134.1 hypothetical protein KMZ68_19425 [Bradyrhizobium sediminis]